MRENIFVLLIGLSIGLCVAFKDQVDRHANRLAITQAAALKQTRAKQLAWQAVNEGHAPELFLKVRRVRDGRPFLLWQRAIDTALFAPTYDDLFADNPTENIQVLTMFHPGVNRWLTTNEMTQFHALKGK